LKSITLPIWVVGLFALSTMGCMGAVNWVHFSADGHQIIVKTGGVLFQAGSSVVFNVGGQCQSVASKNCELMDALRETTETTPFGQAIADSVTYGSPGSPFQYTLTLKCLKNLHAFTLQAVFHNLGKQDVHLLGFDLLDTSKDAGGSFTVDNAADWLVTPLMEAAPALPLNRMNEQLKEAALFCRADGKGFLIGPVGSPEAYTNITVRNATIQAGVQMDGVLVPAGKSRSGQEMIFSFEPATKSVNIWTRWVAITHHALLNKSRVYGWCSWYDRTTRIDEQHVLDVIKTIANNPNVFGKGVIQIDDGYQKTDGDWSGNAKFPSGMKGVARQIHDAGCVAGVWMAPLMINPNYPWAKANPDALQTDANGKLSFMEGNTFHPAGANWLAPDNPKSRIFLQKIIKDACNRGYGYLKIDFNAIGSHFYDPTKTRLQEIRELYAFYRKVAGDKEYILACLGGPDRAVIGYADAVRIGPDAHPANLENCLKSVLRFQIYNNVWWRNDPDVSYLAPKLTSREIGYTPQGEGMWRSWLNAVCLVGGSAMISEPINKPDAKAVWRNFEIMRPSSAIPAKLLTLGRSAHNTVFGFAVKRPYDDFAVYNLYNDSEGSKTLTLDFKQAGLPRDVKCAVFDFWSNRVIGYATNSYTTAPLDYLSSVLLRFTPLNAKGPILVGSNLHLSMGATEIKNLSVSPSAVRIVFSDAGAQEGSLTFFSRKPLAEDMARNCKVTSVENLGGNLWRVGINSRQWGKPQSIMLKIE
jgi:alpha-galactosidase